MVNKQSKALIIELLNETSFLMMMLPMSPSLTIQFHLLHMTLSDRRCFCARP